MSAPAADAATERADRTILQDLARRIVERAASEEAAALRAQWLRHNDLASDGRPLILAFPEGSWRELLPETELRCADPLYRVWEMGLRRQLYTNEVIRDEQPGEAAFLVPWVQRHSGWGVEIVSHRTEDLGAERWDPPIEEPADMAKLKPNRIEVDEEETRRVYARASEVFDGLLDVRLYGWYGWTLGVYGRLIRLMGLEMMMVNMIEEPEFLRDLVAFMLESDRENLDYLERNGYLGLNNEGHYIGSGGLGYTNELPAPDYEGTARFRDTTGFLEAQELVSVSPEMFWEFFLEPSLPATERFGRMYYGCCEPIHDRLEMVDRIPNLRWVSVSPWCDVEAVARHYGKSMVLAHKPNPSHLAQDVMNEADARRTLETAFRAAKEHGAPLQTVMKDTHTVKGDPRRIPRWVEIAREVRDAVWG